MNEVWREETKRDIIEFFKDGVISGVCAYLLHLFPFETVPFFINIIMAILFIAVMSFVFVCCIGFVLFLILYVILSIIIKIRQVRQYFKS